MTTMPGGRPARPAALKLIEGRKPGVDTAGRKIKKPPAFKRLPPKAPPWLPEEAAAYWERTVPELTRLDLVKPVDEAALTALCLTWDRLVAAQKQVMAEGMFKQNSQGLSRHPALQVVESASKDIKAWVVEFGLTPASESKVGKSEAVDDDGDPFSS